MMSYIDADSGVAILHNSDLSGDVFINDGEGNEVKIPGYVVKEFATITIGAAFTSRIEEMVDDMLSTEVSGTLIEVDDAPIEIGLQRE